MLKDYLSAIADFNKSIEIDRYHAPSYINRGRAYEFSGNLKAAYQDYMLAIGANENVPESYINLYRVHNKMGETQQAQNIKRVFEERFPGQSIE